MALRDNLRHNILTHYIKTLFRYATIRVWISLGLMVFLGLTQGVGLLMLGMRIFGVCFVRPRQMSLYLVCPKVWMRL